MANHDMVGWMVLGESIALWTEGGGGWQGGVLFFYCLVLVGLEGGVTLSF